MERPQESRGLVMMEPFLEWVRGQGDEFCQQVARHIEVVIAVQENRLLVHTPQFTAPDLWAMAHAAGTLRDMALAGGFPEAAQYCEETRQEADEMIAVIERTVGEVFGS
jgi:hypothetical protein